MQQRSIKWLVIMTMLVLLFAAGCAKKQEPAPEAEPDPDPAPVPVEQKISVGMVTDVGGLGDQSFNDAAYRGLEQAKEELGAEIKVIESNDMTNYVPNLTSLAEQNFDLSWAIGFLMTDAVGEVAEDMPNSNFGIVDAVVEKDNILSVTFKEEEGSFLAGVVAGMMSKTQKIGFIGGMDVPSIQKFEAGYLAGIKAVSPNAKLLTSYTGVFDDPAKGKEQALALFGQGVDIIYHAAGACGVGVIKAAEEKNQYAIGVDSPQSHLAPDNVLTSMVKRVDLAVFEGAKAIKDGNFQGGQHKIYGLKENGVGLEEDQLKKMAPETVQAKVAEFREKIIAGELEVPDTREEATNFTI